MLFALKKKHTCWSSQKLSRVLQIKVLECSIRRVLKFKQILTAVKNDLADQYPARSEVKLDAHPLAYAMMQLDGDVARALEDIVRLVHVADRLLLEVLPAYAERDHRLGEYLMGTSVNRPSQESW